MLRRSSWIAVAATVAVLAIGAPATATYPNDAKTLVTKRNSGTTFELRALNTAKGKSRLLVPDGGGSMFAGQVSPNGNKIAYFFVPNGSDSEIWIAKADGSNPRAITDNLSSDEYPTWAPDGRSLVWAQDGDLVQMNVDGSDFHVLYTGGAFPMILPNFQPNGQHIVFNAYDGSDFEIFRIDSLGQHPSQLTDNASTDFLGDWSPDSRHIVYASDVGGGLRQIRTMSPNGANQQLLVRDSTYDLDTPVYSANGLYVLYDRNANPAEIWRADATTGKHKKQMLAGPQDYYLFVLP